MKIKEKDIKLLWSRSGNRCANCRIELSQNSKSDKNSYVIGEQAHIVGSSESAPRGNSSLSKQDRNSYHNLIILCPNCHTQIDKNPENWPLEKLYLLKSKHELWVNETLSNNEDILKLAEKLAVTSLVDSAVELCKLESWDEWSSDALYVTPIWEPEFFRNIETFKERVLRTIWTNEFNELEKAAKTFSTLLSAAAKMFMEHADYDSKSKKFVPIKFYKSDRWNENYNHDLIKYEKWIDNCHVLIKETSKALNWFSDIIRRDLNPLFFIERGKFSVTEADDLSRHTQILEYSAEEKSNYPENLKQTIDELLLK